MKFGICCGPDSLAAENADRASSVARLVDMLQDARADYIEFGVGVVNADGDEGEFENLRAALEPHSLRVEAFNSFIPGHHRITGPHVDLNGVLKYCRVALPRCRQLGGEVVVLGSSGARRAPDGFDNSEALQQFVTFCREVAPIAQDAGLVVVIEPLNAREDNLVLTVEHGARLVDEVAHPSLQLLADFYHMMEENEPTENAARAGKRLRHAHVADLGRVAPGFASEGEADFIGFFRALRAAGYDERCSFEGRFENISEQAKSVIALMRERWQESATAVL